MSYKIPNHPSVRAYKEEIADFWEIQAIRTQGARSISQIEIAKTLDIISDEHLIDGLESSEDITNDRLDEVLEELSIRAKLLPEYPFDVETRSLRFKPSRYSIIYMYLLFATRLKMDRHKIQLEVDATVEFEKLCSEVVKVYFGTAADSFVFGTAEQASFEEKINTLIKKTGIGIRFKNPNKNSPTAKDDAVDIVVWKDFSDKKEGKLIAFGQCKTGTSWNDSISQLNPSHFYDNWLVEKPVLSPIPLIFLTDTLNENKNFVSIQRGKLFFNRFRIMEYLPNDLPENLHRNIKTWTNEVVKKLKNDEI